MTDEYPELGAVIESNRAVRQSVDHLARQVGDLSNRMEAARTELDTTKGRLNRAQVVIIMLGVALIAAGAAIGWLVWRATTNREDLNEVIKEQDRIVKVLEVSQCETTAFFLNIALNPAEPRTDQTDAEKKQLKNFIKVYQQAYDRLNCDEVLRGPMLPENKFDQEEPKKERDEPRNAPSKTGPLVEDSTRATAVNGGTRREGPPPDGRDPQPRPSQSTPEEPPLPDLGPIEVPGVTLVSANILPHLWGVVCREKGGNP